MCVWVCASINQCLSRAGAGDGTEPVTPPAGGGDGGMDWVLRAGNVGHVDY